MHIIVCIKPTPDLAGIKFLQEGSISVESAEWTLSHFDLHALEAGVQLVEAAGGKVSILCAGPVKLNQPRLIKDILSRGADELMMIADDALLDADSFQTSTALAGGIRQLIPADLVLCGEGSADLYAQQTGLQLGEVLGWPTTNFIRTIEIHADQVRVERLLESELEVLLVTLPAVLSVTSGINTPRLPTLKSILDAGRKSTRVFTLEDLGIPGFPDRSSRIVSNKPAVQATRRQIRIEGNPREAAAEFVRVLKQERIL